MSRIDVSPGESPQDLERMKSRMPPPLPCLFAVLAGVGLDHWLPWSIGPRPFTLTAGAAALLAMAVLGTATFRAFQRHATPLDPSYETVAIIETGPFRYSRNPAYIGFILLQAAIACFLDNAWILVFIIPAVVAIQQLVVLREEAYLAAKFGDVYLRYKARVRRWI